MQISFAAPVPPGSSGKLGGGGVGGPGADPGRGQGRQGQRRRAEPGAQILPLHRQIRGKCWKCWRPPVFRRRASCWSGWASRTPLDEKGLEVIGAQIVARLESAGETAATFEIEAPKGAKVKSGEAAAHLAFGARLRSYSFEKYRTRNLDEYQEASGRA